MTRSQPVRAVLLLLLGLLAADPPSASEPLSGSTGPSEMTTSPEVAAWRFMVYVDPVLASDRSVVRAARILAGHAGTLTGLGSVEVVLAAPEPELRLGSTRDPKLVAASLEELVYERPAAGDLLWHREELRKNLANAGWIDPVDVEQRVLAAARIEQETIQDRLSRLLEWITKPTPAGHSAPRALLWVADGFDTSPVEFYSGVVPRRARRPSLQEDLAAYDSAARVARFAEALGRSGWITIPLSPGRRPFGLSGGGDLFDEPRAPLRQAAATTGGEVAIGTEIRKILERLPERWAGVRDRPPRLDREALASALELPASASPSGTIDADALGLHDPRPVFLLPLAETMATGRTKFGAQTLDPEVVAVAFRVGDEEVGIDRESPFEVTVKLPMIPRTTTVQAVALNAHGDEIGRDAMEINGIEEELRLTIREPTAIPGPGSYEVDIDVRAPKGAGIPTVDLAWNGDRFETLRHPPYRSSLVVPSNAEDGYLQATATLPDGRTSEAVVSLGQEGFGSRIAVDLVQLATIVEDRRGRPVPGLGRADFVVREDGREQSLHDFGSAEDTPLSVGLTVDVSTSLKDDLPLLQEAAVGFLDRVLGPADRAQIVAFAGQPWLTMPLTHDLDRLARAIRQLSVAPNTALYDALMLALYELRGASDRRAVVLLTDGQDTRSRHGFHQSSEFARRTGIPIYVVVLGSPATRSGTARLHRRFLSRLATDTGGELYFVQKMDQLESVYDEIAEELRHQYLLTYAPDRDSTDRGWHRVEVEVLRKDSRAKTVAGYFDGD